VFFLSAFQDLDGKIRRIGAIASLREVALVETAENGLSNAGRLVRPQCED
jgi:hypothetical protein